MSEPLLKIPGAIYGPELERMRGKLQSRRRVTNAIALTASLGAMAFGLLWLVWILYTTLSLGVGGLSVQLFTQSTPPPNTDGGGLANAIVGSLQLVALATFVGTPIGILAGVYLAEYGQKGWLASITRFINDILLSAPSIVVGLFVYALVVAKMGHFSGWAGAISLALLEIPIVIRTTENMLKLVPNALREAAFALGTPKWKMVLSITLKASIAGIVTGVLLAVARIAGETAPLLFTALSNQFFSMDMNQPMANLPVTIYKFAMSPFSQWQSLAWAGVFLITLGVLGLNILARTIFSKK
ncbi:MULTISPECIES: phosphate ABC transporter permease PstA [Paraburkholderia]|jgi:phosphate transport system permease protein|uniref:Phosphate transport system permease protein PstA n=2 Tax=Paraburkholderia TaxID=1822464 RepID=A0A1A5XAT9_9BURK|nr:MULTISPECIES: phosphate ABC transporter permease PstA [Paraburkholderia]MBB2979508.1 phosphate transport system permease protein [Paraburkholderia tropica]MBB2999998.1 phosphate transport system permease protein [Paraburkholderia tropica]MBB6319630.1 phosphate transport system permease protein [Paraburkholderia tropica]MBN3808984.1 phosphate ABC transporter permease PstA [Paraburkholderia sp. Ac-20347]MDE1142971.1 phosphate ABC transporter permease PstA [Paraburkholderia tropica]